MDPCHAKHLDREYSFCFLADDLMNETFIYVITSVKPEWPPISRWRLFFEPFKPPQIIRMFPVPSLLDFEFTYLLAKSTRLLGSAATLLTLLHNPLNITLLSAQLLSAPAIWDRPDGHQTTLRMLGIFNSATAKVLQQEESSRNATNFATRTTLDKEEWVMAVVKGADESSPRWRHLLLLGGVLLGCERVDRQAISEALRRKLERAMTSALNLALQEVTEYSDLAVAPLVIASNYVFVLLSDAEKNHINYDLLVPLLCWALFFSGDGLHFGYFLSTMDADIVEDSDRKFVWSSKSSSFGQFKHTANSPLVASMGSFSRLIAHSVEQLHNVALLRALICDISAFSRSLGVQWRQNKLSEIDVHEELAFLSDESLQNSLPLMWQTLKSSMFCIVVILRSLLGRVLEDGRLSVNDGMSPHPLHVLELMTISPIHGFTNASNPQRPTLYLFPLWSQYFFTVCLCVFYRN